MSTNPNSVLPVTRQHILDFAVNFLRTRDAGSFRVMDVSQACSVSPSAIYTYFRSREGLIEEAYSKLYQELSDASLEKAHIALEVGLKTKNYVKGMAHFLDDNEQRIQLREHYELNLRILTFGFTRQNFRQRLEAIERDTRSKLISIYEKAMTEGILPATRSAEHWIQLIRMIVLNEVIFSTQDGLASPPSWHEALDALMSGKV